MENGKDTSQVFASKQPRGAALKAATRGHTNIRLRERGTKRVHVFTGSISMVDKPAGGPAWLPDKIKKANVKKVGIEHLWGLNLSWFLTRSASVATKVALRPIKDSGPWWGFFQFEGPEC